MVRSMTGYGVSEACTDDGRWRVEVRSTNHRFLDVVVRMPRELVALEDRVRAVVASKVSRGRVELSVVRDSSRRTRSVSLDTDLARRYLRALEELRQTLGLQEGPSLTAVLSLPEVLRVEEPPEDVEAAWQVLRPLVEEATEQLLAMRRVEGARLVEDLMKRVARLQEWVDQVQARAEEVPRAYAQRLRQRVADLLEHLEVLHPPDQARLATEVAVFADRCDVREELVRLRSHLEQARALLTQENGVVGRKLEFLVQEMAREVNTVGSKAQDLEVSRAVLEMKSELEAMREQVQNLE